MKTDFSGIAARRLSIGLVGLALASSASLASSPAQAMSPDTGSSSPARVVSSAKKCLTPPAARTPKWRDADTTEVSAAVKAKVQAELDSTAQSMAPSMAAAERGTFLAQSAAVPAQIHVPVVIHVIHGRHRGESRITRTAARRMFYTLRTGYNGAQDRAMAPSGVIFDFRRITVSRNDSWFHAAPFSRADRQMKRSLHRGTARVLNIYVNRPSAGGQLLLGFSTFPWQRAARPKLDGVTISDVSLPGGRARGYNLGDTVIHETGHWLGLLHTFEGGCSKTNDGVADTPREAEPSFQCDLTRNSCPDPDPNPNPDPSAPPYVDPPDPVQNFMDYSYDSCMNHFTPGQVERMKTAFMTYRYGR